MIVDLSAITHLDMSDPKREVRITIGALQALLDTARAARDAADRTADAIGRMPLSEIR